MKPSRIALALVAAGIFLSAHRAQAEFITILNPSFEDPDKPPAGNASNNVITNWTIIGTPGNWKAGVLKPASGYVHGGVLDGDQVAYISPTVTPIGGGIQQVLAATAAVGDIFALSFYVAPRLDNGGGGSGATSTWIAELFAGSTLLGSLTGNVTAQTLTPLTLKTLNVSAIASGALKIRFTTSSTSTAQVLIDNVSLQRTTASVSAVPEPATLSGCVLSVVAISGFMRRKRRASGR